MVNIDLSSAGVNYNSPKYDGAYVSGNRPNTAWKIATAYKVGQKLPLAVIYPRPDAETPAYAVHRKASANWAYEMRIAIQGGEAPFRYEIISGPAGATLIGEFNRTTDSVTGLVNHTLPTDYAVVKWPSPTGTANWVIRVTDQSDAFVDVTWSTVTDETAFVVLDFVNGNDANAGTFASPKKTVPTGVWKTSSSDTSYANKIVAMKSGTYPIYQTTTNTSVSLDLNVKPCAFMGIPGSTVVLNTSGGHFYVNRGDVAFINLEFNGTRTDVTDNRVIQISTKNSNYLFWKLKFSNQTVGTAGTDNPACIVFMDNDDVSPTQYVAVCECSLGTGAAFEMICTFSSSYVLVENCDALNQTYTESNGFRVFHMKDDTRNVTIRYCRATGPAAVNAYWFSNQQNKAHTATNQEVCYCYAQTTADNWEGGPIQFNLSATGFANADNAYAYRNTIVSPQYALTTPRWLSGAGVNVSANAYTGTSGLNYGPAIVIGSPVNTVVLNSDLDATGKITNVSKRNTYSGKLGWEIASTAM